MISIVARANYIKDTPMLLRLMFCQFPHFIFLWIILFDISDDSKVNTKGADAWRPATSAHENKASTQKKKRWRRGSDIGKPSVAPLHTEMGLPTHIIRPSDNRFKEYPEISTFSNEFNTKRPLWSTFIDVHPDSTASVWLHRNATNRKKEGAMINPNSHGRRVRPLFLFFFDRCSRVVRLCLYKGGAGQAGHAAAAAAAAADNSSRTVS